MKRIAIASLVLLIVCSVCACAKEDAPDVTTQPTTATTSPTTAPVNPYTKFKTVMAAYNDYAEKETAPLPINQIIFKDNDGCYITPMDDRIFTFFEEGAVDSNKVYTSGNFTLYKATDLAGVMLQAMNDAWNSYSAHCAQEHTSVYDLTNYLFQCDYFEGVYGIDENNQLVQNLVLEGTNCGKFGAFTIYLPENNGTPQGGAMTDADRMVIIRNVYTKFVTEVALDGQSYESIECYIFEYNGNYYRIREWIETASESDAGEAAANKDYDGWHIYLAAEENSIPALADIKNAYSAFVADAALNNKSYDEMTAYIFFDGQHYYATDEWLNVSAIEEDLVGKPATETEFQGFMLYMYK